MKQSVAAVLYKRKLDIMRKILALTEQELLLVNLEQLTPLLERKDQWIAEIEGIDGQLSTMKPEKNPAVESEIQGVVESILENERTLEARMEKEQEQLRQEMRELDQETRLRRYLDHARPKGGTLNVRK